MLDERKATKMIVGIKQLRRALSSGSVREVFLAADADPRLTDPILDVCADTGIPCEIVPTMQELGRACGIDVGAAAAGISR